MLELVSDDGTVVDQKVVGDPQISVVNSVNDTFRRSLRRSRRRSLIVHKEWLSIEYGWGFRWPCLTVC